MANFANFGNVMAGPDYLRARKMIQDRADEVGSSIGNIGAAVGRGMDLEASAKLQEDIMNAWDAKHAADDFSFDEDKFRGTLREQAKLDEAAMYSPEQAAMESSVPDSLNFYENVDEDPVTTAAKESSVPDSLNFYEDKTEVPYEEEPGEFDELTKAERERLYSENFKTPEERAGFERSREIFKKGLTDEQKYRRAAALLAPHDSERSEKMLKYADDRSKLERQLGAQEEAARAKAVISARKNEFIRMEEAYGSSRSRTNQLTQQYAQQIASGQPDAAAETKREMEKWNSQGDKQYARLNAMDPNRYPDFDKAPKVTVEELGGDPKNSNHARLANLANESVKANGEIDPTAIMALPENEQKIALKMAKEVSAIKAGNIKLKTEQSQGDIDTATKAERLAAERAGTTSEQQGKAYYDRLVNIGPQLKPVNASDMASLAGTGIKIVDLFNKVSSSPEKTAALNYIMTILRKESGAAISGEEITQAMQAYIPSTSDTEDQRKMKSGVRAGHLKEYASYAGRLNKKKVNPKRKASW